MATPTISINLFHDFAAELRERLENAGHSLLATKTPEEIFLKYYDFNRKFPPVCPRRVLKPAGFSCPSAHASGLALLESKIQRGEDLRPHLSTTVEQLDNLDLMLLDWEIFHFHLGTKLYPKNPAFIERTGPLLYARLTSDNAYFVGILEHGEWANPDLIRVLHDNWPESIETYRIKGVLGLTHEVTAADRQKLRKAQINTGIDLGNGIVYIGPGMGISTSGISINATRNLILYRRWFESAEKRILGSVDEWINKVNDPRKAVNLKLQILDGVAFALDEHQSIQFKLGKPA